MHPLSLSGNSASAARRPEEEVGFGCFGQGTGHCWGKNGSIPRARAAQAWRGEQHAARNPGTRRAPRPFPHPPPPPALRNKARLQERGPPHPQRVAKTSLPYRRPLPGVREHSPLRTARGHGLPQRHSVNTPQLAWRRQRNGSDGGAGRAGSVRVRMRTKRV